MHKMIHHEIWNGMGEAYLTVLGPEIASPQTSFGVVRHVFISLCGGEKWMRDERTLKDVCEEARPKTDEL